MSKKNPLLSDDDLDELVKEINQLYGGPTREQNEMHANNENESD